MKPNNEMLESIILSVKPVYNKLILSGEKKIEYRNFRPLKETSYFWVYETVPYKELKYIMKIKNPIIFPDKITKLSYGVERFNSGEMKNKYAYEIEEIYMIEEPIKLEFLKGNFGFVAPQAYTYLFKNKELQEYLKENVNLITHKNNLIE